MNNAFNFKRMFDVFSASNSTQAAAQLSDISGKADSLEQTISNTSVSSSNLMISFYALVAWVIIITLALAAVAVVTYRRWKSTPSLEDAQESSFGSSMSGSIRDITKADLSSTPHAAYDTEAPPSVIASVHARVSRPNSDEDTASPVNTDIVTTSHAG